MRVGRKTVLLSDVELRISIGVHAAEKKAPQRLLVSVEATLDGTSDEADDIAATLDYDAVHAFVKSLEAGSHLDLQETVARKVLGFVLARPGVVSAVVVTKKPDVFSDAAYAGLRLEGDNLEGG